MKEVKLNLFNLKKQLEVAEGRDIDLTEMAEGMGLNYYGLMRSINGKSGGVQFDTLSKMLYYFRSKGLNVSIGDLLIEVDEGKLLPANPALAGVAVA